MEDNHYTMNCTRVTEVDVSIYHFNIWKLSTAYVGTSDKVISLAAKMCLMNRPQ